MKFELPIYYKKVRKNNYGNSHDTSSGAKIALSFLIRFLVNKLNVYSKYLFNITFPVNLVVF